MGPTLFENAWVAGVTGSLLGVALLLTSRFAVGFMTPDDPGFGLVRVALAMVVRAGVVLGALAAFYYGARDGLAPFGIALALSFIVGLIAEAVRISARRTSTSI